MFSLFKNKAKSNRNTHATTYRYVTTARWVHCSELQIGMYVRELDCPWEQTLFMFQGFKLDNMSLLNDVQQACEYVLVETKKLAHVSKNNSFRLCGATR